jgi:nicotinate-nucleotide adenylyltransferase
MLHFWKKREPLGRRLGILPAAFNPVTHAHLAIARHASQQYALDEVLFLLPRVFPHKDYAGATFDQRLEMMRSALAGEPRFSIGSTDEGLFIDIARACRAVYGSEAEFFFLCGRDAAERIVNWDYGEGPGIAVQLQEFQLLVAARGGPYVAPAELATRIHPLEVPANLEEFSSSGVRRAIARGERWEHLVPGPAAAIIRRDRLYRS